MPAAAMRTGRSNFGGVPATRYEHEAPNRLWQMDFNGRRPGAPQGRSYLSSSTPTPSESAVSYTRLATTMSSMALPMDL